ncbi:DUF3530 family protein [Marinobacter sp. CHS3-4]|uniref:DUF3530 family protein n=1 Tax=Marinobacter sp. CHS3-4 TaxID=3045174 RepID=UPI0024B52907|nr:DUF3530 family protein [Marinobacter sp. CHS3-4]MDI9244182.1 DUF3530 family protein [Marinobacter sp. CHS3-4]
MNSLNPIAPPPTAARVAKQVLTCISLMALFMSQPVWSQEEQSEKRLMVRTGMDAETIAGNRPDSAVWLSRGDQGRVLALFQPEQDPPAKGALVVLADEGVSAASGLAEAIRAPLSKAGWAVMTLGLEPPPFPVQQWLNGRMTKASKGESADASDTEEESSVMIDVMDEESPDQSLADYRDRVESSITAAVDALEEREYDRIVLAGIGRAAGPVTRQARADGRPSDLVWIAPQFYSDESEGLVELLRSATNPSVLELYSTFPGDKTLDRSANERAAALKRAGIDGYQRQPVAMSRRPQAREAHAISNRISAWLGSRQSE